MEKLQDLFKVTISPDKMEATIQFNDNKIIHDPFSYEELMKFISEKGVKFGLLHDVIKSVHNKPHLYRRPVVIAKGITSKNGVDGYLQSEIGAEKKEIDQNQAYINLREINSIPSVMKGQKLATIVPPEQGEDGTNVVGMKIPAKKGKPFRLRPGKNIELREDSIYAAIDGQISFGNRSINVFPMYEVSGDLDLKTGNIDFIGNVVIRGNVPNGYTVKSKGDINIYGLVECAEIIADGSIYITGGITALNKGLVKAGVDIHTSYINQGNVEAGRDIIVERSILQSNCIAGGSIQIPNGTIIGGVLSVGRSLEAKTIGNKMYTKTDLFFGVNERIVDQEKELQHELMSIEDITHKLQIAANNLLAKLKQMGSLTDQEKQLLLKQRNTIDLYKKKQVELREELEELQSFFSDLDEAYLLVFDTVYPNTITHFGKFANVSRQTYKNVKVHLNDGEVSYSPL